MNMLRIGFYAVAMAVSWSAVGIDTSFAGDAMPWTETQQKLRDFADARKAAMSKLGQYAVTYTQSSVLRGDNPLQLEVRFEERHAGASLHVIRQCVGHGEPVGGESDWQQDMMLTDNGRQMARYIKQIDTASIWDYQSVSELPSGAQTLRRAFCSESPINYTFADGKLNTETLYEGAMKESVQSIFLQQSPAGTYMVTGTGTTGAGLVKLMELEIDPAKGNLIVGSKYFDEQGRLMKQVTIEPREIEPALWFPSSWRAMHYGQTDAGETVVVSDTSMKLESLSPRQSFAPEQFSYLACGFQSGTEVMSNLKGAWGEPHLYFEGALLSREQFSRLDVNGKSKDIH